MSPENEIDILEKSFDPDETLDDQDTYIDFSSDPDEGGIEVIAGSESKALAFLNSPTLLFKDITLPELSGLIRAFNEARTSYLDSLSYEHEHAEYLVNYLSAREELLQFVQRVVSAEMQDEVNQEFYIQESETARLLGASDDDVQKVAYMQKSTISDEPTQLAEITDLENEVLEATPETSEGLLESLLAHPPIEKVTGLPAEELQQFLDARRAYFTEYVSTHRSENPRRNSARLYALSEQYFVTKSVLAGRIRSSSAGLDTAGKEFLIQEFLDERTQLLQLRALAEKEAIEQKSERKKGFRKKLLGRVGRAFVAGLALFAAQSVDYSRPNSGKGPSPLQYEVNPDPLVLNQVPDIEIPVIESVEAPRPTFEPIYATSAGPNQMFVELLTQLKQTDESLYQQIVRTGESDIVAAERLSQQAGFWKISEEQNQSAILYKGDTISVDEAGTIVFTRGDEAHDLIRDGRVIAQDWLTLTNI